MNTTNGKRIEILAPVGGQEQLIAAVRCGADAVYFGMRNFNARRNAENFGGDTLEETVRYCHARDVKVYITVNTLVTDSEIPDMRKAVDMAAEAGADALIVQDLAVTEYMARTWPQLKRYASTQMAAHNEEGVRFLTEHGFDRVVLARELSLPEIREIIEKTKADCEVFVHGAHCMSVSGNCYLSAMIGGRSGNRGLCAQPCRLDWKKDGRDHVLSLKDLSYITHIEELDRAGVGSLKIEGRMKRAEYVAAAVTACRDALEKREPDLKTLQAVFSRSGFTDGYLTGKRNTDMFGFRTKEDVISAKDVLSELGELYRKEPQNIPIDIRFEAKTDEYSKITVSDGTAIVQVEGDAPERARNPQNEETVRRNLKKTGGTPFYAERVECELIGEPMLPMGQINAMRRQAVELLTEQRSKGPVYEKIESVYPELKTYKAEQMPAFRVRFGLKEQICKIPENAAIILPIGSIDTETVMEYGDRLIAEIPAILWQGEGEKTRCRLEELHDKGLKHLQCSNIGALDIAKDLGLVLHGGMELNVLNSVSMAEYAKLGLSDLTVSFELSFAKIKELKGVVPFGIIVYGRLPLMKFRNCPGKSEKGCIGCKGDSFLTDRMNERFPLYCREGKYTELLNCVPLYAMDKKVPGTDFETVWFTIESREQCKEILNLCLNRETPPFRKTGGLYFREIL